METGLTIRTSGTGATVAAGEALAGLLGPGDVILLSGDLGAGKTTLVKGIAAGMGVRETVTSPTFNLLVVHEGSRLPLFHLDLYRLEAAAELTELDYWGVLESGGVAAVEWGDRFPAALPEDYVAVSIHIESDEERVLGLSWRGARGRELATGWTSACRVLGHPGVGARGDDRDSGDPSRRP